MTKLEEFGTYIYLEFPYNCLLSQLRIFKPYKENSRGSTEFPKKIEVTWSKGSKVMIGHSNKQTNSD